MLGATAQAAPPTASLTAPDSIDVGEEVEFTATASDPETDPAPLPEDAFRWDFDNDGAWDDAVGRSATHVFTSSGSKVVRLRVTDPDGEFGDDAEIVQVSAPANQVPIASFRAFPAAPTAGQTVDFVSTSSDPDGPIAQLWDLDGDGQFDDAAGPSASRAYGAGARMVRLRVIDADGARAEFTRNFVVAAPLVAPRLLSPFPVVRLVGNLTRTGARIRRFRVAAPAGSSVVVRCNGPRCPTRRVARVATGRTIRFRRFERRLRAGVVLRVFVSREGAIGKYTRFGIRRRRSPSRRDRCLMPGVRTPSLCPAS